MQRLLLIFATMFIIPVIIGFNTIKNPDGTSAKWNDSDIPIIYYINPENSGLNETDVIEAIKLSFEEWSKPDCTYVRSQYGGTIISTTASPSDYKNLLFFIYDKWPDELGGYGTIAVCTPAIYSDGYIKDADIRFNAADFKWSTSGEKGKMDLQNIATHEIGHFFGLDHTMVFGATMYPYSGLAETGGRSIEEDDIKGICYLYPDKLSSTEGEFGTICEYNTDCKSNICVATGDKGVCSQKCTLGETGNCPNGYKCYESTDGSSYCFPGDNSSDLCKLCESANDCSSELCLTDGNMSICSRYCVVSSSNCPSGYYCAEMENGGGGCWPDGDKCDISNLPKDLGEICFTLDECKSGLICVSENPEDDSGKCYYECNPKSPQCPPEDRCVTLNNQSGACMPKSSETDAGIMDASSTSDTNAQKDSGSIVDIDIIEELNELTGCECSVLF